jgi:predicted metal-binding membrane protein
MPLNDTLSQTFNMSVERNEEEGGMAIGWASMMAAMMLPAALPALVSLRRAMRALAFAAGFLGVWVACGAAAFVAYDHSGLMDIGPAATVALLAVAALYELSPLKRACLRRCRANAYGGPALVRGARNGTDCIGSCAGLMLALFALDPMSIGWMLAVSALVFVQVALRPRQEVARS